jgi:4-amino-4-deoxy-L-arabinose transferase-like glycosyltransferase
VCALKLPRTREAWLTAALLVGTAVLYLVGVERSGWANSYYAAAVQAGAANWEAFFFGSSDAANSITVDKPPAALWVMGLSVRLFGLSSWSLLVPEALMGVAAVALLVATVRRAAGPGAALLAGLLLALTPVLTLMARVDDPDALLTLLLVAAAWSTGRALDDGRLRWTLLTGTLLGLAFLTKSLQAFLVLPALAGVLLVAGPGALRRRAGHLLAGGAALVVAAGWWLLAVALVPSSGRPWIGGSSTNSALDLALGYNGLGRLTGDESGGGATWVQGSGSPLRLFGSAGDQIGWLLPAAAIALVAGAVAVRGRPRTDPLKAALVLWGGWIVTTGLVFSFMRGIWHSYYTVEMAPAVAALVAVGATLLWRRDTLPAHAVLAVGSLLTTVWAVSLIDRRLSSGRPVALVVETAGLAAVLAVGARAATRRRPVALMAAGLLLAAAVVGPAAWSVATVLRPHTGSAVSAGPAVGGRLWAPARAPVAAPLPAEALALLRQDPGGWTWTAATIGHRAADLQLAIGAPVMPIGGFFGRDPSPTLQNFQAEVAAHRVHWFVPGTTGGPLAAAIERWVHHHAQAVRVGSTTLYDLSPLSTVQPLAAPA